MTYNKSFISSRPGCFPPICAASGAVQQGFRSCLAQDCNETLILLVNPKMFNVLAQRRL